MVTSIASTLGIGSGIDTAGLVDQLAEAARAPKDAAITRREEANSARISSLASAANGIDGFAKALSSLISGGTLFTQPSSSDTSVVTASALPGARIGGLSAQIEVTQLAQAQTLASEYLANGSAAVGQGTLTLTTSAGSFDIVIDATNDNLIGLANAINGKNAGVTARVVEDSNGARLVLKGGVGAAKAFTLTAGAGAEPGLSRFAYDPGVSGGMTRAQQAQDAIVKLDGVTVTRASNSITDLISGVTIELKKANPGVGVALGATRPTAAIRQAVTDFVDAFNELKAVLDEATAAGTDTTEAGPLRGDVSIREMQRQLARLASATLNSAGGPATLAEIGVRTERTGALSFDTARLDAALAADPDGVEALFNPGQRSDNPLVVITSPMGRAKPGTYFATNLVAASGGQAATGTIAGVAALSSNSLIVASASSSAFGLVLHPLGDVASATITVDQGLGGALQAIRDALLAKSGPIKSAQARLDAEAKSISADRAVLEARSASYRDQLVRSFTGMDRQVSAYKATQSYLEQQIKIWTNGND